MKKYIRLQFNLIISAPKDIFQLFFVSLCHFEGRYMGSRSIFGLFFQKIIPLIYKSVIIVLI